ncbi:SgcJ/EcaC family oxidoreductase [Nonomuraea sp. NPDC059023]|uniref:SgcJ/EcaC family oxidoreductase n=1 Tax=unclassified Nonomuraea TaxID=2593643 RepID=UPI0036ABE37A
MEDAIRQLVADASRHQNDPEPFLALHADDTSLVNFGGRRVVGKDAVEQAMKAALATPLAKVVTSVEVADIRFVRPDVAIVGVLKRVSDERDGDDDPLHATEGWLTYVLVENDGRWQIASAQTTPILKP